MHMLPEIITQEIMIGVEKMPKVDTSQAEDFTLRLRSHAIVDNTRGLENIAIKNAMDYAKQLPAKKREILLNLFSPPLPSSSLLEMCYNRWSAVQSGRNASRFVESESSNSNLIQEAESYLDSTKLIEKIKNESWERLTTDSNALVVIDAPLGGGEPYFSFVSVGKLHAVSFDSENTIVSAIVRYSDKLYIGYDKEKYIRAEKIEGEKTFTIIEIPHPIGRAPIDFFWSTTDGSNKVTRTTPVTRQLSLLDEYNFSKTAFLNQKSTSIFPLLILPEQECGYTNDIPIDGGVMHETCNNGLLFVNGQNTGKECPACGGKIVSGAGVVLTMPMPRAGETELKNPAMYIAPTIADVEFTRDDIASTENKIVERITGRSSNVGEKVAVNESQVSSILEDRNTIIKKLADNLSAAASFIGECVLRLKFNTNDIRFAYSYGTEFFNYSESELVSIYENAKAAGAPTSYIREIERELEALRTRTNPMRYQIAKLSELIEPYSDITFEQALSLSPEIALTKVRFKEFMKAQERKGMSLKSYLTKHKTISASSLVIIADFEKYLLNLQNNNAGGQTPPANN